MLKISTSIQNISKVIATSPIFEFLHRKTSIHWSVCFGPLKQPTFRLSGLFISMTGI